jgi:photosystem II stability/assembly factor-like uncharacterized protein
MRVKLYDFYRGASRVIRSTVALPFLGVVPWLVPVASSQTSAPSAAVFNDMRWRSIGPPRSGYISAPAGVPGDPTTYYVGTPEGGVWKTTNAGTTWTPIFDDVHVASIGAVAVAPSEPNTVYVGTGNQSGWSFTPGDGVHKTIDGGRTWTNIGLRSSQYIGAIIVDPRNANTVLVAAQGGRGGGGGRGRAAGPATGSESDERGVYRTIDGGRTWSRVLPTDGSSGASDLYYDYADPQIVYAALSPGASSASTTGIFKSTDGGANWQPMNGRGLPDGARVAAFAVASGTHGRRLYALVGGVRLGASTGGGGTRGLYRSDDGGETWTLGAQQLASAGGKIYADPQHPDVMYLMGTSIYRSLDGGRHIASFWGAPSGADPRFLWIDPTNAKRIVAGVDQGVAISVDAGASWTPYYGLVNGQFYRVATDYDFPYHVCGPQQDSGTACVASRSDFGIIRPNDWYPAGGFENGFLIADPLDKRYMYTQGWYHVLRRYDRTTGQVVVLYQPTAQERFGGAPPLAFGEDKRTLYMAAQYVLASSDGATTWRVISPDLTRPAGAPAVSEQRGAAAGGVGAPAPGGSITALAPSPVIGAGRGVIWAGTSTGLVHVTRDAGKTWANVTPPGKAAGSINIIDASHHDAGAAYVAVLSGDRKPHVYRTLNFGGAWQEITVGMVEDGTARVVREDPVDPNLLYAGTVTSAYVSFDRGDHWQSLQLNLPNTVVSDMTVHGSDLVISTYGRGFWILDDVSPLRQARTVTASRAPAFFFLPDTVIRARWDNTQDTPMPPEMVVGQNPPEGAILDYYLAAPSSGPVTLTISDSAGHVIRAFSSIAPPADTIMPNVPEYWLQPPTVLSTGAGMHRINWDLRYPDPPTLNYGYYGTLLDYREYTLNWHATPGHTYRSTIVGTMVLPGTYTATLTVDGRKYVQPITIVRDPRVTVSAAALAAQFRLEQRMVAGLTASYEAVNYVQQLRAALTTRTEQATGRTAATQIASAARALDAELAALVTTGFGIVHRDLGRRYSDQFIADAMPTPSVIAGVDEPCKQLDATIGKLRSLETTSIAALNAQLTGAGLSALPPWTRAATRVCDA